MPRALMAKLHSWFSANSRRCCSFIAPSTVSRVISGDSAVLVTGRMRPLTFIDGGTPAVMNRSEPPFSTIRRSSCSKSMGQVPQIVGGASAATGLGREKHRGQSPFYRFVRGSEVLGRLGLLAGAVAGDHALGHQVLQAGVEGLHALRAAGLDQIGRASCRERV